VEAAATAEIGSKKSAAIKMKRICNISFRSIQRIMSPQYEHDVNGLALADMAASHGLGMASSMSKQSLRPSVRKLSRFDICSILKKSPAPSLGRRRRTNAAIERAVLDALRRRVKTNKGK